MDNFKNYNWKNFISRKVCNDYFLLNIDDHKLVTIE